MARLYGRSPVGERCLGKEPHGHWHSCTFTAALRYGEITAPFLLDGPMDGAAFLAYIQQELAPTLRPGDIVICDNLASHKVSGVRQAIEAVGAQIIHLPAYSPDFNPIEQAFSKIKSHLRSSAARTYTKLQDAIVEALDSFTPDHCANLLMHANYMPS